MEPEVVVASGCGLGESPTWDERAKCVYWADIRKQELHRFSPESGTHETVLKNQLIGGMALERDGSLLLLGPSGGIHRYGEGSTRALRQREWRHLGFRFNDAIADPAGRVVAGLMPYDSDTWRLPVLRTVHRGLRKLRVIPDSRSARGRLCQLSRGGRIVPLAVDIGRPNGMGFAPDLKSLYVTDSSARRVYAYRYDVESGSLTDARLFLDLTHAPGIPDGLAVDVEGCVWSVRHKAGYVGRYTPDGREVARVNFPTPAVTSLAFGGSDNTDLYVTSGGADDPSRNGALAGALFRFRAPVAGGPVWASNVTGV